MAGSGPESAKQRTHNGVSKGGYFVVCAELAPNLIAAAVHKHTHTQNSVTMTGRQQSVTLPSEIISLRSSIFAHKFSFSVAWQLDETALDPPS